MTFYETLKDTKINGRHIYAYRKIDKYSNVWNYEIVNIEDGQHMVGYSDITKTAKTTWRKKYNEIVGYYAK